MDNLTSHPDRSQTTDSSAVIATAISFMADYGLAIALLAVFDVLRGRRSILGAALRLAALGIPIVTVTVLSKRLFDRERPEQADQPQAFVRTPTSSSFPSGHTLAAAAAAVALPMTPWGFFSAFIHLASVGWSRLRLGTHHGSDVAGGVAIGVALGLALRPLLKAIDMLSVPRR